MRCGAFAENETRCSAALGRHLQAAQLGKARTVGPAQHGATGVGAQRLLGRPQRIAAIGGAHDDDARQIDAGGGERRRVRQVRRRDPGNRASRRTQMRKCRAEDAQFAYALMGGQDFGERSAGPAAARQFGVQRGKAAGDPGCAAGGGRRAAPDAAGLQDGGKRGHGRTWRSVKPAYSDRRGNKAVPWMTSGKALADMRQAYRTIVRRSNQS